MPQGEPGAAVGRADLAAFGVEMAMIVTLALGGWRLGSTRLVHITLAVVLPALAAVIWAVWMAPSSRRRVRRRVDTGPRVDEANPPRSVGVPRFADLHRGAMIGYPFRSPRREIWHEPTQSACPGRVDRLQRVARLKGPA